MALGLSLALAGEIAARLVALLALLGALMLLVWLAVRWSFLVLRPRAGRIARWFLERLSRHPLVDRLFAGLLDPSRREHRALLISGAMLIASAWLFLVVLEDVIGGAPLVRADQSLYELLQSLRTPWGDRLMVVMTQLGDAIVITAIAITVFAWLAWRRAWRTMGYWAAAICFGQLTTTMLKSVLERARPETGLYEGVSAYSFPSGHATMSTVTFGLLAVLVARDLSPERRWLPYAVATSIVSLIALSRMYLGAHWLSDVVGGVSLGLAWVSLLAIAYYRHRPPISLGRGLTYVAALALAVAGAWNAAISYPSDLDRYAPKVRIQHLDAEDWWRRDWRRLPTYRWDLEGELEQPFNVQWAGTLDALRERLVARGWREPIALGAASSLRWLSPAPRIAELPVLPQVHDGRDEDMQLIHSLAASESQEGSSQRGRQIILRLWRSGIVLEPAGVPLWVGGVSLQRLRRVLLL
ncbi:MAG: phosphatase PAP2 family protein, partial [Gammaproteobacteria bacterium]